MTSFTGLSAFPITPSDGEGRVDVAGLRKLVARLRAAKVDSVGLLGSTGSYVYLSREERRRAIEAAVAEAEGAVPVMAGVGALRTDEAIRLAQDAKAAGAVAGLLAPVSYTPLTDEEVFGHFSAVAGESGLPICIYDNPGTTHFRFTPALVARLSQVPGVVAVKSPAMAREETLAHLALLRGSVKEGLSLGYAADWNSVEAMIGGADAWYSVLGGVCPAVCVAMVRAAQRGDAAEARRLNASLAPLWELFKQYSSLRVAYALADILGICKAAPPLPVLPLSGEARKQVEAAVRTLPAEVLN